MTVFKQAILSGALSPRHFAAGLWLSETDHGLDLRNEANEIIGAWGIYALVADIKQTADAYMILKEVGK